MNKIEFKDYPDLTTPINANILNQMQINIENAINEIIKKIDNPPLGTIFAYPSLNIPEKYMICDGRELNRTEYANLFSIIGESYGSGDGQNTFNIPDFRGRTIFGYNEEDEDFNELGKIGGNKTHTQTIDEMPSHRHNINYGQTPGGDGTGYVFSGTLGNGVAAIYATGGNQPMNIMNPHSVACYIIKVSDTVILNENIIDGLEDSSNTFYSN